jgi:hypothetical protein
MSDLDGGAQLGEGAGLLGLVALLIRGGRGLVLLAEGEGQGRLALLGLDVLLGLAVGGRGSLLLGGLDGGRGGVSDGLTQRGRGLDGGESRGGLAGDGGLGLLGGLSGSSVGSLLLLLAEDTEDGVALGGNGLLLLLLDGLVLNGSLGGGRGLSDRGSGLDGGGSDNGLGGSGGSLLLGSLSARGDSLGGLVLLLGLLLLAEEAAEDALALAAGRAALLGGLLGSLLGDGRGGLDGGNSSGSLDRGSRLGGLSGSGSGGLLLLGRGSGLEGLEGGLVGLSLGDSRGNLLGLSDLQLQLRDPVVAVSSVGSLEGVLAALGGEVELGGAIGGGLSGIGLGVMLASILTMRSNCHAHQVDDADGGRLLAEEEKALAGVRGPGGVVVASLGGLLAAAVVGERLGVDGVGAEPEELLGVDEVPGSAC